MLDAKVIKLPNGLTLVLDNIPHVNSVTLGIWSSVGSRVENTKNNGISHFLEHMVFKGTKTRSALQIAEDLESKGGYMNAYTSKERTAWYAKVLTEHTNIAIDIIFDILLNSTFPEEELVKEKGVIKEEIKMYLDSPQDLAANLYEKLCYNNNSLAMPIIGTEENILSFNVDDFKNHINHFYTPDKMVMVLSGNFSENEAIKQIEQYCKDWNPNSNSISIDTPSFHSNKEVKIKENVEQTVVLYGHNGLSYKHDDFYKLSTYSTILGGGMSSRIFTEIREKRGLAYYADTFTSSYSDCGSFGVQVGCNKDNVQEVIKIINQELLKTDITESELQKAKNQIKSSILMSMESTRSRCERLAGNIISYGEIKSLDEAIEKINNVSIQDIKDMVAHINSSKPTVAIVSNENIEI